MANDKQQELKDTVAATLEAVLKEVLPAVLVASKQADRQSDYESRREDAIVAMRSVDRCGQCGQLAAACHNEHEMMVVFPKDEQNVQSFDGIRINGVVYRSSNSGAAVCVPKDNCILTLLNAWENAEREMRNGKKVMRNSGTMSPYGAFAPPQTFV
jgi:predicted RNA-binding protein (virulence factor B family)